MAYSEDILKLNPGLATLAGDRNPNKYGAVKTNYNGECFDSKREAAHAENLDIFKANGQLQYLRQVTFPFKCGTSYRADFLVFDDDGCHVEEVKGHLTDGWKIKRKLMASEYPFVKVVEIR